MGIRHIIRNVLTKASGWNILTKVSGTLLILLLSYSVQAQDKALIDSLNQAYKTAKHDTDKLNALFGIGAQIE